MSQFKEIFRHLAVACLIMPTLTYTVVMMMVGFGNTHLLADPYVWSMMLVFGPPFFSVLLIIPVVLMHTPLIRLYATRTGGGRPVVSSLLASGLVTLETYVIYLMAPYEWLYGGLPVIVSSLAYGYLVGVRVHKEVNNSLH